MNYKRDCKLGFGEYVQVYAEHDITNTIHPRTYIYINEISGKCSGYFPVYDLTGDGRRLSKERG